MILIARIMRYLSWSDVILFRAKVTRLVIFLFVDGDVYLSKTRSVTSLEKDETQSDMYEARMQIRPTTSWSARVTSYQTRFPPRLVKVKRGHTFRISL